MKNKNSVRDSQAIMAKKRNKEAGQSLVLVALSLAALLGMVGLGIDMGYLRYQKGRIHAAADAAALAAGAEIGFPDVTTAAQAAASANGFTNGSGGVTVTVNNPPLSGSHTADVKYVEVIVSQNQRTFFMNVLGVSSVPLSARTVATGSNPYCIYGLATSGNALIVDSSTVTTACGVAGDMNLGSNTGTPHTINSPYVALVGTVNNGVTVTPAAKTGVSTVADPFASLPAPANGDSTCIGAHPTKTTITTTTTLSPGTYCGGILINTNGITVTFNAGTYYLYGGGLQMGSGMSAKLLGTGVTFYNSGTGSGICNTCYGSLSPVLAASSNLTAPTASGTYEGILFFQDPANTLQATFKAGTGVATGSAYMEGAYYFPGATLQLQYDFGNSTTGYTLIVAKTVWWLGSGAGGTGFHDDDDFSHLHDGDPDRAHRRGRRGES